MADQLLQEPAHLVGNSYGGIVAMLAAARRPESVRSLTVIEPPAAGAAAGNPAVDEWAEALRALFANPGDDLAALLRRFFDLEGVEASVPDPLPESLERGARALATARPPTEAELPLAALATSGIPLLVISGGHHEGYEAVCDAIAAGTTAQRAVIPGAGHLVPDTGEPFNRRLEEFLVESS